jgi:hypothetical protein
MHPNINGSQGGEALSAPHMNQHFQMTVFEFPRFCKALKGMSNMNRS